MLIAATRSMLVPMLIGTLKPTPPYDFAKTISAARLHTVLDVIRLDPQPEYWRAVHIDEQMQLVRVVNNPAATIDDPCLDVYWVAGTGTAEPAHLLGKVGHLLGIEADLRPFYVIAQADERLWRIVEPLYGLKHVRAASVFEALVTTIIEQQIALSTAQKAERWLVQWIGNAITHEGEHYYAFPTTAQIARLTVEDLKPLKITNKRMAVLIEVARQIEAGAINVSLTQTPQELFETLVAVKGIGRWTAAWTIIRALGDYLYIGENDVALQAAINYFFYDMTTKPPKATPQVVRTTLERYGSMAGAVAFFTLMHWGTLKYYSPSSSETRISPSAPPPA